ncbi:MAG TPA: hypothetical protein ENG18_02105 [Nitrososphaeria archaeon]|nr:hypothetical protein [Nitrososphaeria archaeon]
MSDEELKIHIKYGDLEAEFSGSPEAVYHQVVAFLEQAIPEYSLAKKIQYNVELKDMLERLKDYLAYNPEAGIFFLKDLNEFPFQDAVYFIALKNYLEYKLGRREKPNTSISDFSEYLPRIKRKTLSNRVAELSQGVMLKRLDRGDYAITIQGIKYILDNYGQKPTGEQASD